MGLLTFLARRFVAGERAEDAVRVAREMNRRGIQGIVDFLGEDVSSRAETEKAALEYLHLLSLLQDQGVSSSISLKASQMGLLISQELCEENLSRVVEEARRFHRRVWMDMEGSRLTQMTLEVFCRLRARYDNLGLCLQAYLRRTAGDLERLMLLPEPVRSSGDGPSGLPVRICKGAYKEPSEIAFPSRAEVDANYRRLAAQVLAHPEKVYPAFATHDLDLIRDLQALGRQWGIDQKRFEFQMLYGIRNRHLEKLAQDHFLASVYIPYGRAWLPYYFRRLKERKENLYFLIRNVFRM